MPRNAAALRQNPFSLPPMGVVAAWTGGYALSYVLGFAALTAVGLPSGMAPLASGAATALLFTQLGRRRKANQFPGREHLRSLGRLTRSLGEVQDADRLATQVVGELRKAIAIDRLYFWLPSREKRDFHLSAGVGPDPGDASMPEAWLTSYFQPRARDAHGAEVPTPLDDWLMVRGLDICMPIQAHGRTLGLLVVGQKADGPFSEADRWLLDQVLRQAALTLAYLSLQRVERKRRSKLDNLTHLYKAAQKRAITDGLTGLNTHVFFKEQLAKRFSEARRHREPLGVMLVDVDHFKRINDSYGHPMGDEVLRRVAGVVKHISRTDDTVARYGGEELSLVLPQTDMQGASVLAERIREAVEALELQDAQGRSLPTITVSVGLAILEARDQDHAQMIERADKALYVAKRQGRNQVCKAG